MLTLEERHEVLAFLRLSSIFCTLPIRVDVESWNVSAGTDSRWKSWICTGSYVLFAAHALLKVFRAFYTLFYCTGTPLHQIMLHFDVVLAATAFVYWYYLLYVKYPNVNAGLTKITLAGAIATGKSKLILARKQHFSS